MTPKPAVLVLADGTQYHGISIGAEGATVGELVFNTAMTGYQEIVTDPSYTRQIVTLTAAHVGNTGCNAEDMESNKVWAAGLVIRDASLVASNYRSEITLSDWLNKNNVVAIAGIDTRDLTLRLREKGAMGACISTDVADPDRVLARAQEFCGMDGQDLAYEVSRKTIERWDGGKGVWGKASKPQKYHVVAYDFGIKHNILRILNDLGCHLTLVPARTSAAAVMALNPDGVFLSNGPGDPKACAYAIEATKSFINAGVPVFGICLGFQILALACGGATKKMMFGHHGSNHPVIETGAKKRVYITSQNHGFTVDEAALPDCLEVTHRSLFDDTLQGIKHKEKPAYGFQGHPEASPGPHDIEVIFDDFIRMMK